MPKRKKEELQGMLPEGRQLGNVKGELLKLKVMPGRRFVQPWHNVADRRANKEIADCQTHGTTWAGERRAEETEEQRNS
ncbi:hypothetical protein AVEN_52094-1 [Araneus ventricosus]|uniref:Uncharacterized protein n=1 Tax=Araneus ventricosus TaxID=182803 RepID=A0A4Y2VDM2_ARAVE|nr:hypothetical protein AVEN_52094-1 [Araneus ventricosus]